VERRNTLVTIAEEHPEAMEGKDPTSETKEAEADLKAKQAQLDAAKSVLDQCEKKARTNGKVLRVQTHVGEYLTANPQAPPPIQFAPEGVLIARAEVLQEWADRVHQGQEVIVATEPRSKQQWRGRVRSVSPWFTHKRNIMLEPLMFNDVRTLECIIDLDGNPPLRIGQRVRVTFIDTK